MPKLVESMLKVFKREKKGLEKDPSKPGGGQRSVLDADSFIFMPGDTQSQYWGEILNDDNFPISQLRDNSRRKTHIGFVQGQSSGQSDGMQEVNLIISPDVQEKDGNLVLNGKVFNRRLSGTLVKAKKSTDEVEDGPIIRDYAFLLTARDRLSQELSGRYVYDRLIRSPLQPRHSAVTAKQPSNPKPSFQWKYPSEGRKSPLLADRRKNEDLGYVSGPRTSTPSKDNNFLRVDRNPFTCTARDRVQQSEREQHRAHYRPAPQRPLSGQTVDSQAYSNLELARSVVGSEYAMPTDALSWEQELEQYEVVAMREYRNIPPHDLMLGEKIGEGQFGDVHSGFLYPKTVDEIEVAIKTCKPDASNEDRVKFLEEASVMCKFKHPNIIKLFGVVSHMDLAYIVMELAPHGQLRRYLLLEGSRITRLMLLSYIAQLASAMVHLEDMNYVHRDIAARNVLVCNPQTVKLADFGLSRGLEDGDYYVASRGKLPIKWMAPESINFRRFTGLSDVWMFGVCCWEILMRGVKPFVGIKNDEVISKIESGERLALPMECPAPLYSLMNMCWRYDPLERPRFLEIEARIQEIIGEMMDVDQRPNSSRQRFSVGVIQRDPNAPAKPQRHGAPTPPMVARVPSNNSVGADKPHMNEAYQQHPHLMMDNGGEDGPPLPPRAMERFRELSTSPPSTGDSGGSPVPPTRKLPPQAQYDHHHHHSSQGGREGMGRQPNDSLPPPPPNITPYSVTTITVAEDRHTHQSRSDSPMGGRHHVRGAESPLGGYHTNSHIPPPAILAQNQRSGGQEKEVVYYSAPPQEVAEKKQQRVLTKDGIFVSRDVHSPHGGAEMDDSHREFRDPGVRPKLGEDRPMSHASTEGSSGLSSPPPCDSRSPPNSYPTHSGEEQEEGAGFTVPDEDETLKLTMGVVKTVKELSDKVHKSKPGDYVELVKSVGLALRDLLGKVDQSLSELPHDTHTEVAMAQKVLSSDMNHLVMSMKDAQAHYDKFLEQEYQRKMLKAAHVVAVNSKLLLDAVNSAKHKARLMR